MIINVLENNVWNPVDSTTLNHITHGVYVFHFHPDEEIYQQMNGGNRYTIITESNIYKFGRFKMTIHNRIIGNPFAYSNYWRYAASEAHVGNNRAIHSDSFELSTTRYLIWGGVNPVVDIKDIEDFFISNTFNANARHRVLQPLREFYQFDIFPSDQDFLGFAIEAQTAIKDFINGHQ